MDEKKEEKKGLHVDFDLGLGGLFGGIGELVEQAAKLAETTGSEEAKARVAEIKRRLGKLGKEEGKTSPVQVSLGGLFSGLGKILEAAATLKETEEKGEFTLPSGKKGMYSFGIRVGPVGGKGGERFKVEPFGHRVQKTPEGRPIVEDVREPEMDVIEEKDDILVVGDMPGAEESDIHFEVKDKTLTITSEGNRKYRKEVELPTQVEVEKAALSYRNGVLELKLPKIKA